MSTLNGLEAPRTEKEWHGILEQYCIDRDPSTSGDQPVNSTLSLNHIVPDCPLGRALSLEYDGLRIPRQGEDSSLVDVQEDTSTNLFPGALQEAYNWADGLSADDERMRMREHYEEHGWMCAPRPSRRLRIRRRKAIRLLGLDGDSEDVAFVQRRRLLHNTLTVARDIFNTEASITILRETDAIVVTFPGIVQVDKLEDRVESHFNTNAPGSCVVLEDLDHDWRFKDNPRRRDRNINRVTAAPLQFRHAGHKVDVGYLCLYNSTIDNTQHALLQHLAEMLVQQLFSLQSQHTEHQYNAMYEICISFLRRGVARARNPVRRTYDGPDSPLWPSEEPHPPVTETLAVKSGPREQLSNRVQDIGAEQGLLQDYCSTLRKMIQADIVTIIGLEDFNIFAKSESTPPDLVTLVSDFNQGIPFPAHIEPVITTNAENDRIPLIAYSCPRDAILRLNSPARSTVASFLKKYLQEQRFWWDRETDLGNESSQIIDILPDSCQTTLSIVYFTPEATPKFVTLAGWNRPASTFDETSLSYLHFAWVLSGSLRSALAVRRNRWMESSHLTYANTQAHNLKTPLHHILAVTQILRSSITDLADQRNEQVKDLLPLMDAIDTSGSHLQSIIDNILSFLELKGMERIALSGEKNTYAADHEESNQSLGEMLEEVIAKTYDAEARARKARAEHPGRVETIFNVTSGDLATSVAEDPRGLLRATMTKLLANAYKAVVEQGTVMITLESDDPKSLGSSHVVRITLSDDGPGMSHSFVQDRLGEPWAKEDPNATGSGLSVYLAYRMVDLLHGHMDIQSGQGKGCTVTVVVPLQVRESGKDEPRQIAKRVALVGFSDPLEEIIRIELGRLGTAVVEPVDAEIILCDGRLEETTDGMNMLVKGSSIVYLVFAGHESLRAVTDRQTQLGVRIRRVLKPATHRVIKDALRLDMFDPDNLEIPSMERTPSNGSIPSIRVSEWTPDDDVKDMIAELALGQMPDPSGPPRLSRQSTSASQKRVNDTKLSRHSTNASQRDTRLSHQSTNVSQRKSSDPKVDVRVPNMTIEEVSSVGTSILDSGDSSVTVLVVEDNVINRKILVKILKSRKDFQRQIKIVEAGDGQEAVEIFEGLNRPSIVLLDINMPKLDGFGACTYMRAIESKDPTRGRSQIIAITAMSGEADRQRGISECGMTAWLCKPISKPAVVKVVDEALAQMPIEGTA